MYRVRAPQSTRKCLFCGTWLKLPGLPRLTAPAALWRRVCRQSGAQRRVVERLQLLAQVPQIAFPVAMLAKPGKGAGKGRVEPAMRYPGRMVQHAQRPQGLDERD